MEKNVFTAIAIVESLIMVILPTISSVGMPSDMVLISASVVAMANLFVIYRMYTVCKNRSTETNVMGALVSIFVFSLTLVIMHFVTVASMPFFIECIMYLGLMLGMLLLAIADRHKMLKALFFKLLDWSDFKLPQD